MLEEAEVIYRIYKPMIPPQVTYGLTERAQDLIGVLDQLNVIAQHWYAQEHSEAIEPPYRDLLEFGSENQPLPRATTWGS